MSASRADVEALEHGADEQTQWMPVSDLMAALMMVFLLISVAMMRQTLAERERIREIAVSYQQTQMEIHEALRDEFEDDLAGWGASLDAETLEFTFLSPDVLFPEGKERLTRRYEEILTDFFPRYMDILAQPEYRPAIEEIRIEGHTSSEWNRVTGATDAYFENMRLSQGRTRSVLRFVHALPDVAPHASWIRGSVAAVGFSSAKVVLDGDGNEDQEASRRVTFRVVTNADTQIRKILAE